MLDSPCPCQDACTADPNCKAFTYVTRPPLVGACCLKGSIPAPDANPTCTSGVKAAPLSNGGVSLPLLPGDAAIDVRVFVDNTFMEVFVMQARPSRERDSEPSGIRNPANLQWSLQSTPYTLPLQGRLAFTMPLVGYSPAAGMSLFASAGGASVQATDVSVWHLGSIWVSPAQVLAQRDALRLAA